MQSIVGFDLLLMVTGVKMYESNVRSTTMAQVLTAVHIVLLFHAQTP